MMHTLTHSPKEFAGWYFQVFMGTLKMSRVVRSFHVFPPRKIGPSPICAVPIVKVADI